MFMKLRCIVVDDEPLAVKLMESYVRKTPFLELAASFESGREAFEFLSNTSVDVVFCDIQMPQLSGIELSRMLPEKTRIIFTTAFSDYAVEGFRVHAVDYLLKPVSYNDFLEASMTALKIFETESAAAGLAAGRNPDAVSGPRSIFVKTEYQLVQIDLDNILYIEGMKDYVRIVCDDGSQPVMSLMNMKSLEELLPSDRFVRVHRSYIVQPSKIRTIERNRIVFGSVHIPVSDTYRQTFYDFLSARSIL